MLTDKYNFVKSILIAYYKYCPFSGIVLNEHTWVSNFVEIDHIASSNRGSSKRKKIYETHGLFINSLVNLRPIVRKHHSDYGVYVDENLSKCIDNLRDVRYTDIEVYTLNSTLMKNQELYEPLFLNSYYPISKLSTLMDKLFIECEIEKPFWFNPSIYVDKYNKSTIK